MRLWTAITWRNRLAEFASRPGPIYIGASGAVWVAAGIFSLWCMWSGKPWTRRLLAGLTIAYSAWFWVDRLLLQQAQSNWPFLLILNVLAVILVFFTLRSRFFPERGS
ncbi:MAG TPA: hypothetical protein VIV15_00275 [Anaerolineales bacterium]